MIRPCRKGRKIGPLAADDRATAEVVLSALLASVGGGEIFLDVPSINRNAVTLAQDLGLAQPADPGEGCGRACDLTPVRPTPRAYDGVPRRMFDSSSSPSARLPKCPARTHR